MARRAGRSGDLVILIRDIPHTWAPVGPPRVSPPARDQKLRFARATSRARLCLLGGRRGAVPKLGNRPSRRVVVSSATCCVYILRKIRVGELGYRLRLIVSISSAEAPSRRGGKGGRGGWRSVKWATSIGGRWSRDVGDKGTLAIGKISVSAWSALRVGCRWGFDQEAWGCWQVMDWANGRGAAGGRRLDVVLACGVESRYLKAKKHGPTSSLPHPWRHQWGRLRAVISVYFVQATAATKTQPQTLAKTTTKGPTLF